MPLSIGGAILGRAFDGVVRVEVVFSTSCYSLSQSPARTAEEITKVRQAEERAAAQAAGYEVRFMGLPEPFVRPGYRTIRDVFDPRRNVREDAIWLEVREAIGRRLSAAKGVVLWPLRCGNHIDHRMVFESLVEECQTGSRAAIGLYEDLPYASRYDDEEIRWLVPDLPVGPLKPVVVTGASFQSKLDLLNQYPSQLMPEDVDSVYIHWMRLGGERLWLSPAAIEAMPAKPSA